MQLMLFLNCFPVKARSCSWKSSRHELNIFSTYTCQVYPSTKYVCLRFLEIFPSTMYLLFVKAFSLSQLQYPSSQIRILWFCYHTKLFQSAKVLFPCREECSNENVSCMNSRQLPGKLSKLKGVEIHTLNRNFPFQQKAVKASALQILFGYLQYNLWSNAV